MAKVTFFQPTELSDLPTSIVPGVGTMSPTYAINHSPVGPGEQVAFVSLLGEGFNTTNTLLYNWKGNIHSAMIDTPDDDWHPNILIENPPQQPSHFGTAFFAGNQASVVSTLMSGSDKVLGSEHADTVFELGGGDVIKTGAGDDTLEGGTGDDRLIGGRGKDTLLGGAGRDGINGGPGKDNFVFADPGKTDRVVDFAQGEDSLLLDNAAWNGLGGDGGLKASAFKLGGSATDADDRILYNANTGDLKYDANGDKSGGVTLIARLDPHLGLGHQDFEII